MQIFPVFSLAFLLLYFAIILSSVLISKSSQNLEDYFLAGRQLPFWALAVTFIASWWGAGSAVETADNAFKEGLSAFWEIRSAKQVLIGMLGSLLVFITASYISKPENEKADKIINKAEFRS
jgi:Na+/proline symporter